eukprot:gnl/MRDRNA2_/MRDRNA2_29099_c0_seq1.p1 gnl/MRDRNA2_/MRDRNA2_29099_c0~~gnl/MRDRNA2_/MRDRNA2_29099_c0_seq1.p1  ORF type:complete len:127 (+),score=33.04 gnl/MRDRNA2_/MRDRNA2_29099_c0_seq1:79-459(+)
MVRILIVSLLAVVAEAALKTRTQKSLEEPAAPAAAPAGAGIGYDLDAFKEEWRGEWKHEWSGDIPKSQWKSGDTIKNGDSVPGWKVTNTHANGHFSDEYLAWEDSQSDGKKSVTKSWYTMLQQGKF